MRAVVVAAWPGARLVAEPIFGSVRNWPTLHEVSITVVLLRMPAIAVTAYDKRYPPTDVTGWAAYFRKPVDPEELVKTINAIVRGPGAGPS